MWLVIGSVMLCCHFGYHALLELNYGSKWQKSLAAKEWVKRGGMSVHKAEHCMDAEMFLMSTHGGRLGAASPHHPPRNVSTYHCIGAEGGRKADSWWLLAWCSKAGP